MLASAARIVGSRSTAFNAFRLFSSQPTPQYSVVRHPTQPEDPNNIFAIIKLGGTQHKIVQGDIIISEKLPYAKVGEILSIDEVLMIGTPNYTVVGRPLINGAKVEARVEEQTLDKKILIFKSKKRSTYRRKNGFRREVTVLRVTDVKPITIEE